MNKIYIPATSAEQWAQFLAEPVKHWRKGYSARALAFSWQEADGLPAEVKSILETKYPGIELLLALPEHKVHLPGGSRPSQNDVWVLASWRGELVSIAVEGKVAETFGPTVQEWQAEASLGKSERLGYLKDKLGLANVPPDVRYQLLHRAASALSEGLRFTASHSVMLVHSFSKTSEWFDDYAAFVSLMGGIAAENKMVEVRAGHGRPLCLAWVRGDPQYLEK